MVTINLKIESISITSFTNCLIDGSTTALLVLIWPDLFQSEKFHNSGYHYSSGGKHHSYTDPANNANGSVTLLQVRVDYSVKQGQEEDKENHIKKSEPRSHQLK